VLTGPVVDTESALEFQREITRRLSEAELRAIAGELRRKCDAMGHLLKDASRLDRDGLKEVLGWVFSTRRRADELLDAIGPGLLGSAIAELLDKGEPVADRFEHFDATIRTHLGPRLLPGARFDLGGELLHFSEPDRYWLWTRWIWDPDTGTGALGLVTTDHSELGSGLGKGATYLAVGRAMAFVDETGKAAGFTAAGPGLLGLDVLLAAVYGIYMYTVLQMRMTREFSRVLPPLADLVRRLLGVQHLEA
jgi:hypothetical protein